MTVGEKIKKYRLMNNMTQKALGKKVGFSTATADSRIRKYELDLMAPKKDLRQKLADSLGVDISALSDINIQTYEDVMQILFLFEEEYGMKIKLKDNTTQLIFNNDNKNISTLISYLFAWADKRKEVTTENDEIKESLADKYSKWKAEFPKSIHDYWNEQQKKIEQTYELELEELNYSSSKLIMLPELINHIREMIKNGITIEANTQLFGTGSSALELYLFTSEMINFKNDNIKKDFAKFLFFTSNLRDYGLTIDEELITTTNGTQIIYRFYLPLLSGLTSIINEIYSFENNPNKENDYTADMFEAKYEQDLIDFNINIKEEIEFYYQK